MSMHQQHVAVHIGLMWFSLWQGTRMMLGLMGLMKVPRRKWMGAIPDKGTLLKQFATGGIALGFTLWAICTIR